MLEQYLKNLCESEFESDYLQYENVVNAYKFMLQHNYIKGLLNAYKYLILHMCINNTIDKEILDTYNKNESLIISINNKQYKFIQELRDNISNVEILNYLEDFMSKSTAKNSKWREIASKNTKAKLWFNNGVQNYRGYSCPEGFVKGRLKYNRDTTYVTDEFRVEASKRTTKALIGKKWFNNGIVSIRAYECPEGYVPGRLNFNAHKNR